MAASGQVLLPAAAPGAECGDCNLERRLTEGRKIVLATLKKYFHRLPAQEAEDIAQDICLAYWQQQSRIRVYQAWFYTAARSRAVSALRRHQSAREVNAADRVAPGVPDARHEAIRQIFFTLRGHCRQLLGCLVIAEWTISELAREVRRDARALNDQRAKCLKVLRHRWLETTAGADEKMPAHPPTRPAKTQTGDIGA